MVRVNKVLDLLSLLILTQLSFGFPKPTVGTFKPSKVSCRLCWYLKSKSSYIKSNRWISGLIFLTVLVKHWEGVWSQRPVMFKPGKGERFSNWCWLGQLGANSTRNLSKLSFNLKLLYEFAPKLDADQSVRQYTFFRAWKPSSMRWISTQYKWTKFLFKCMY